jgi:uncharacterized membrane protein
MMFVPDLRFWLTAAFVIHIPAIIIWLGSLFLLVVVLGPGARSLDVAATLSLWPRVLSRFFVWGGVSLILILATGVAMVFMKFGGYGSVPTIHRFNMVVGVPAIALYAYLFFIPWRRLRHALTVDDGSAATKNLRQIQRLGAVVLALGLLATVVSAIGRYYTF